MILRSRIWHNGLKLPDASQIEYDPEWPQMVPNIAKIEVGLNMLQNDSIWSLSVIWSDIVAQLTPNVTPYGP